VVGILRHGGPLLVECLGGCPTPTTRQASGGDRHLNFYGNRDNLLTLRLTAYDNGMVQLDGVPINVEPDYDLGDGWLGATEVAVATIHEFYRQVTQRQRTQ
jgi:hypothetical protein